MTKIEWLASQSTCVHPSSETDAFDPVTAAEPRTGEDVQDRVLSTWVEERIRLDVEAVRAVKCPKCSSMCLPRGCGRVQGCGRSHPTGRRCVRAVLRPAQWYGRVNGFMAETWSGSCGAELSRPTPWAHPREANPVLGEHGCGNSAFRGVSIDAPPKSPSGPSATSGVWRVDSPFGSHEGSSGPPVAPSHQPAATMRPSPPSDATLIVRSWTPPSSLSSSGRNVYTRS